MSDQRGGFALGRAPLKAFGGLSGQQIVTSALTKVRDGHPLDFAEEYGLETLWHEILHNSQKHVMTGLTADQNETLAGAKVSGHAGVSRMGGCLRRRPRGQQRRCPRGPNTHRH